MIYLFAQQLIVLPSKRKLPTASTTSLTVTPARARAIMAVTNARPISSRRKM